MFNTAKIITRQGNKIIEQYNEIKQYKEENAGLRDEIGFKSMELHRFKDNIDRIITTGEARKEPYVIIIDKIKELVSDCESKN